MLISPSNRLLLLCFVLTFGTVIATDHIVGANKGWNPGMNYTLWANNHTFYVGDLICTHILSLSLSLSLTVCFCICSFVCHFLVFQRREGKDGIFLNKTLLNDYGYYEVQNSGFGVIQKYPSILNVPFQFAVIVCEY